MKFVNALLLAAGASIGTAVFIDKHTDGAVHNMIEDLKLLIEDDIEESVNAPDNVVIDDGGIKVYESVKVNNNGFDILTDPDSGNKSVIMPLNDAINLYRCIEESVDDDHSDYDRYGDKAISFERLYDLVESELEFLDSLNDDNPR